MKSTRAIAIVVVILMAASLAYAGSGLLTTPSSSSQTQSTSSSSSSSSSLSSSSSTSSTTQSCSSINPVKGVQLSKVTFDAITEYTLPTPVRSANAIQVAPDGSVWFGEESIPGVGHLYPNGTLYEYPWPLPASSSSGGCPSGTNIWGLALWNGSVWASDSFGSRLVGVNPTTGSSESLNLTRGSFPYAVAVGPDNSLWFTELFGGAKIGKLSTSLSVQYYNVPVASGWEAAYLLFPNKTLGYVLEINPATNGAEVMAFNPQSANPTFTQLGGNTTLYEPSSIAVSQGGVWLTEHSGTSMAFFNSTSETWTIYPLSSVPFVDVDLSYFNDANATAVWFNEHYANRMGVISGNGTYLTEYSVSNPPVTNITDITNAISIALGNGRFWFTEWTGNRIGFVNTSYVPPFSVNLKGNSSTVTLSPGGSAQVQAVVSGNAANLSVHFTDNEIFNSTPSAITFVPNVSTLSVDGSQNVTVTISAASSLAPGDYVAAITVTNGLIYRSVYLHIVVEG